MIGWPGRRQLLGAQVVVAVDVAGHVDRQALAESWCDSRPRRRSRSRIRTPRCRSAAALGASSGSRKRRSVSKRVGTRTALDTAPHDAAPPRAPARAHRRLHFEAGEFVALEFRSDASRRTRARRAISSCANTLKRCEARSRGSKKNPGPSPRSSPSIAAIAGAEDHVLPAGRPLMLRIEIERVEHAAVLIRARGDRCDRSTPGRWSACVAVGRVQRAEQVAAGQFGFGVGRSARSCRYRRRPAGTASRSRSDRTRCGNPPGRNRSRLARRAPLTN